MENKLQNLKFRVYSEQHSKAIQKKLLEIGYNFEPRYFDKKYLFIFNDNTLSFCITEEVFIDCEKSILLTIDDLYKMQAETNQQSELMTKLESIQKQLDSVKEEISKLNK